MIELLIFLIKKENSNIDWIDLIMNIDLWLRMIIDRGIFVFTNLQIYKLTNLNLLRNKRRHTLKEPN